MQHSFLRYRAFTLVELLVVLAIIGVLASLLIPAVNQAREAARVTNCKSNLRQISLATDLFHTSFRAYPPARYQARPDSDPASQCGDSSSTWLVRILPFLDHSAAAKRWEETKSYGDQAEAVRITASQVYRCPSRRAANQTVGRGNIVTSGTEWLVLPCGCKIPRPGVSTSAAKGAVGDYGGNHGDLSPGATGSSTDFYYGGNGTGIIITSHAKCADGNPIDWVDRIDAASVTDGLSNTLLVGEMHVPLGKLRESGLDAFIFNGDQFQGSTRVAGPTVPLVEDIRSEGNALISWGSWHGGVVNFAMGDGSIRSLSTTIDTEALGQLANRMDNGDLSIRFGQ